MKEYRIAIPATIYITVVASRKRDALSKAKRFHEELADGCSVEATSAEAVRAYANDEFKPSIEDVVRWPNGTNQN